LKAVEGEFTPQACIRLRQVPCSRWIDVHLQFILSQRTQVEFKKHPGDFALVLGKPLFCVGRDRVGLVQIDPVLLKSKRGLFLGGSVPAVLHQEIDLPNTFFLPALKMNQHGGIYPATGHGLDEIAGQRGIGFTSAAAQVKGTPFTGQSIESQT